MTPAALAKSPELANLLDLTSRLAELVPNVEELQELRAQLAEFSEREERPQSAPSDYRAPRYATTTQMCEELGFERTWAYGHRKELGAHRMGTGPKARMRWDMEVARAYWSSLSLVEPEAGTKPPRRRAAVRRKAAEQSGLTNAGNELLPVADWNLGA